MEKHHSLRAICEYESNYFNAAGYWFSCHDAGIDIRQEWIKSTEDGAGQQATYYDVWALIAIRYALRVLGLRTEFYKMSADDPTYTRMVMQSLERRGVMAASDDLDEPLETLQSHMTSQLMKAVAKLSASNATKRVKGKGGPADGQ